VCAHYDHLGKIGTSTLFPGANDNASGTAFMLELAAWFSKKPLPWSLLFIAFSAEEAGLQGSRYLVQHPPVPLSRIRFVMNLDLIGFGDKGATVVNGTVHEKEFRRLVSINSSKGYLPEIKARGKAANSDHYPFSEMGVPAFFLYTLGGPGHYHDISDRAETVTFSGFINTFGLVRDFLEGF
jgi:Zn-dependent M28 family amino/carboxypeptidase